jgi:hypothetical protein
MTKTPAELRDEAIDRATDAGFALATGSHTDGSRERQKTYLDALNALSAQDRRIAQSNLRARLEQHHHEAAQAALASQLTALDLDKLVSEPIENPEVPEGEVG